jgi:hypothetical protein
LHARHVDRQRDGGPAQALATKVVEEVFVDRKYMKGGKSGKASGRTLPVFDTSKPHILAWLQCLVGMLKVKDPKAIDPSTPLFLSRVRNKDGSPRAIARETAWHIIKAIARENEFSGKVDTQSTRKTLAGKVYTWPNDIRVVQGIPCTFLTKKSFVNG